MNKVFEIHLGYVCAGLVFLIHLILGFYLLYILQIDLGKLELPSPQKIVWYSPPATTPEPIIQEPVSYIPPPTETNHGERSVAESNPAVRRTASERRASWSKTVPEQSQPQHLDAVRIVQEISEHQAQQRAVQAVYTKREQVQARATAQMLELTQERLRNKVVDALKIICHEHDQQYYSQRPIASSILLALVISQEGEIISVELLRSTGTKALDEHIITLLQEIKKIAVPARKQFNGVYSMTFEFGVRCQAGMNHLEVIRADEKSTMHIV